MEADSKETRQGVTRVVRREDYYVNGRLIESVDAEDQFRDLGLWGKIWLWIRRGW